MKIAEEKIDHFKFEEDFIEANIRCIPMIVRFKLDACGIKLKLAEWSKMTPEERAFFSTLPCETSNEIMQYRLQLESLIFERTGNLTTDFPIMQNPIWGRIDEIPFTIVEKLNEFGWSVLLQQWQALSDLQRFALLKLSYPGHENKNFPKAIKEFELA